MNEQTIRLILGFLEQLGINITMKVERFIEVSYPILEKQLQVELFRSIFFAVLGVLLLFITYKWFKFINEKVRQQYHYDSWEVGHIGTFVGGVIGIFFTFGGTYDFIVRIINPEWYIAKMIFDIIQNGGL